MRFRILYVDGGLILDSSLTCLFKTHYNKKWLPTFSISCLFLFLDPVFPYAAVKLDSYSDVFSLCQGRWISVVVPLADKAG